MITREDLPVKALVEAYDLGPWRSMELIPGGKSQHYHLVTGRGEYVMRRSRESKTLEDMRFEHELVAHLNANGFPAFEVVPAADGKTWFADNGDLYSISVFVKGHGYDAENDEHLRESARALARYHRIIASFHPSSTRSQEPPLNEILRQRLETRPSDEAVASFLRIHGDSNPRVPALLATLPYTLDRGEAVLGLLDRLYPRLPQLVIHGGCRRGSAIFAGDRLITMLDFDSARHEARVVDLAIAFHDFGKVFGDRDSPDFKVPLDLDVVSRFVGAYQEVNPLEPAEIEALPALLKARPLKRAIGKYRSMVEEERVSDGHMRKTAQEVSRVGWLEAHADELQAALQSPGPDRP